MTCTSLSFGTYVASEYATVAFGRTGRSGQKAIVYAQGSHGIGTALIGDTTPAGVSDRFIMVCGDLSQTTTQGTFGNDTSVTRIGQLRTFIQGASAPLQAAAGKVSLFGVSGGATACINYARANPANVSAMYLICPLVALDTYYDNYTAGTANGQSGPVGPSQSEINKAYNAGVDDGGTAFEAALATHDPSASGNQAALSTIPIKMLYSTNDPYVAVSDVTTYRDLVNAAGGNAVVASQGAVGHSANGLDPHDLVTFFEPYA